MSIAGHEVSPPTPAPGNTTCWAASHTGVTPRQSRICSVWWDGKSQLSPREFLTQRRPWSAPALAAKSKPRILRPNLLVLLCGISCSHQGELLASETKLVDGRNPAHPTAPPSSTGQQTPSISHLSASRALKTQHQPTGTTGMWDFVQPQTIPATTEPQPIPAPDLL